MVYTVFFSLQNAVCFIILTYLVPVLFTFYIQGVVKLKKNNSSAKRLIILICGTWRWASWTKTCCKQISRLCNKPPLFAIDGIFLFLCYDHHNSLKEIRIKFLTRLGRSHSVTELAECNWSQDTQGVIEMRACQLARQNSLRPPTGHEPTFGLSSRVAGAVMWDGTSGKLEDHRQSTRGHRQASAFLQDFC